MNATTIGLDIAKNVFQAHGVDAKVEFRKKLARAKVLEFFGNLPPAVVGMEACPGAHCPYIRGLSSRNRSLLLLVRMSATDLLGPNQLLVRTDNLSNRRDDNPQRDAAGNEGIE